MAPRTVHWHDPKRYAWLLGLVIPISPFLGWGIVAVTGSPAGWFVGILLVFGLLPILDWAFGLDSSNPPDSVLAWLEDDRYYRWCIYSFLPLQYAGLVFACWIWTRPDVSLTAKIGLALTIGAVAGLAINAAHELGHKKASVERWMSKVALAQSCYGHFYIEHNRGHHVRVSTPEDPASSRFGESFYAFWPRTVFGSLASAIGIERTRLQRGGKPFWSLGNDLVNAWLMSVALFAVLFAAFGLKIAPFLLLQAVMGFSLLEVVNYVEHYGLLRTIQKDGRYERCLPAHSWNSDNVASNVFLYHLQRHSDHHAHPVRRYQALRTVDDAPSLPSGYATMILLALAPPLWRLVMDHRVLAHYSGDITRVNIQPSAPVRVLGRRGAAA
jgi:alkane 1-monooxygenase